MITASDGQRIVAKLTDTSHALEGALQQSDPRARYDPAIVPESMRDELAVLRDDLARIIRTLKESS